MKGYFSADQDSLAMGLIGAGLGAAAGRKLLKGKKGTMGKHAEAVGALAGLALALGGRAVMDPQLKSQRA